MMTPDTIIDAITDNDIQFLDLWFTDIMGIFKSITVPSSQIERVIEHGVNFDGSAIDGFARVAENDMVLLPDLDSFAIIPWSEAPHRKARLICTVHTPQGDPFIGDPRTALIRVLKRAEQMGYIYKVGTEMEFFLFKTDQNGHPIVGEAYDAAGYFDLANHSAQGIHHQMMSTLESLGITAQSLHSEIGQGQHEIDFQYADALSCADQILTARVALKVAASQQGAHCTFMPRPDADLPGSGMHMHQSLHNLDTEANLFMDTNHEYGLSETACYFLAGQLAHARAMSAILAPLVNSYKRLRTSFEAPIYVSWAHINRAALIRIPSVRPGLESHTRLELRCPDPTANPYLALAAMLQAGLDGISNKLPLPEPLEETLLTQQSSRLRQLNVLPATLGEALAELEQNDVIVSALGPYIGDRYLEAKKQEFEAYNQYVTSWELNRYLDRY